MKNKFFISMVAILVCFFIAGIGYVSILGENHKINQTVETFFDNLKTSDYNRAYGALSLESKAIRNIQDQKSFLFCVETTLLKSSNLINETDYSVNIKRESFWIPFISSNSIPIDVALIGQDNKDYFSSDEKNYLKDIFTVYRENGAWKIKSIDIEGSYLSDSYNEICEMLHHYDGVSVDKNMFRFDKFELDLNKMSPIDKRIVKFVFWNAGEMIEEIGSNSQESQS